MTTVTIDWTQLAGLLAGAGGFLMGVVALLNSINTRRKTTAELAAREVARKEREAARVEKEKDARMINETARMDAAAAVSAAFLHWLIVYAGSVGIYRGLTQVGLGAGVDIPPLPTIPTRMSEVRSMRESRPVAGVPPDVKAPH